MSRRKATGPTTFETFDALDQHSKGMSRKRCRHCSLWFGAAASYQDLCPVCFKRSRGWDFRANDAAILWLQRALSYAEFSKPTRTMEPDIDAAMVRRLILLCHPDRHDNSTEANEVTGWLLDVRREVSK
jgi:hypothetical protein